MHRWVLNTTTATWHSPIGDAPDDLTAEEKAAEYSLCVE